MILWSLWWWVYCSFGFVFLTGRRESGSFHNYYWNNHQIKSLRLVEYSMSCANLEFGNNGAGWERSAGDRAGNFRWLSNSFPSQLCPAWLRPSTLGWLLWNPEQRQEWGKQKRMWLSSQAKEGNPVLIISQPASKSPFYRWSTTFLFEKCVFIQLWVPNSLNHREERALHGLEVNPSNGSQLNASAVCSFLLLANFIFVSYVHW